jgi:hypothetical protein
MLTSSPKLLMLPKKDNFLVCWVGSLSPCIFWQIWSRSHEDDVHQNSHQSMIGVTEFTEDLLASMASDLLWGATILLEAFTHAPYELSEERFPVSCSIVGSIVKYFVSDA